MSAQELLTYLFNAIALGFLTVAAMDFATRSVAVYNQVTVASNSSLTNIQQPLTQLPLFAISEKLLQLPDPWLLPLTNKRDLALIKLVQTKQKPLQLLPPAKETNIAVASQVEDLLLGVNIDKLKLREARRIAKVLGIAQKVNGKDQKLSFLRSQIKLKLQQERSLSQEVVIAVKTELVAC